MIRQLFAAFIFSASTATAQGVDPDIFANTQNFTGAPFFVREAKIARDDVPGVWPFKPTNGDLLCLRVDGIDMAFFDSGKNQGDGCFLISNNLFMSLIGKSITQSGYLRDRLNPKTIGKVLADVHAIAMRKCGPPYFQ